MEARKVGNMTVNDGKGLYDNDGLIEKAIVKLNEAIKDLTGGQYISFCGGIEQIAQILVCLKKAVKQEKDSSNAKIEELKRVIRENGMEIVETPIDNGGADNGTD